MQEHQSCCRLHSLLPGDINSLMSPLCQRAHCPAVIFHRCPKTSKNTLSVSFFSKAPKIKKILGVLNIFVCVFREVALIFFFLFPLHFFQFLKFQQKLEAAEGRQLRPSTHALLEVWPLPLHSGQLRESTKEKRRKKLAASFSTPAVSSKGACIPSGRRR